MVAIHGDPVPVRAEISQLHGLSAHADQEELLRWVAALPGQPQRVFLNHGEDPPRKTLSAALHQTGLERPFYPSPASPCPGRHFALQCAA